MALVLPRAQAPRARDARFPLHLLHLGLALALITPQVLAAPRVSVVRAICAQRIEVHHGGRVFTVPGCRRDVPAATAHRAIIVVHGVNRNAEGYYRECLRLAGDDPRTLVIAPQFLTDDDATAYRLPPQVLCWGDWQWGGDSTCGGRWMWRDPVSSFEVVDAVLRTLADRSAYPQLQQVTLVGHSAGGQFVNRYAAAGMAEDEILLPAGIAIHYVVVSPSSFIYFDEERRVPGSQDVFAPARSFLADALQPRFNDYGYGLGDLEPYPYLARVGADTMRRRYPTRQVTYLVGEEDDDPNDRNLARSAPAMLQGENRLERSVIYYNYLRHVFGPEIEQTQRLAVVPGAGHESGPVFRSEAGLQAICGDAAPPTTAQAANPAQ